MCKRIARAFVLGVTILVAFSCGKETTNPETSGKHPLGEINLDGITLTLLSDRQTLEVGFNPVYIQVKQAGGGQTETPLPLKMIPVMDMHSMDHSCPTIQPVYNGGTGYYEGGVIFTMPSGDMGTWKIRFALDDEWKELNVQVNPAPSGTKPVASYQDGEGNRYWITLAEPRKPRVGIQDLHLYVHQQHNMHHFAAVDGLSFGFEPEMPSMGHGSPNNVAPVAAGEGLYKGKVNFTMTGDWKLNFELRQGETLLIDDASLEVLF